MAKSKFIVEDKKLQEIIKNVANPDVDPWVIHDGVEYGVFQEFGKNGHPSLIPAFEKVTKDWNKIIGQAIEDAVNLNDVIRKAAFDIQALWARDVNVDTGAYKNSIIAEKE